MPQSLKPILHILESLRAKSQVADLLRNHDLAHSGTWKQVKKRLEDAVSDQQISIDEILSLVERIEEHGDQFALFYDLDPAKAARLKDIGNLQGVLHDLDRKYVLNHIEVIASPTSTPILVSVRHITAQNQVVGAKLKWVQNRTFRKQISQSTAGKIVTVKYRIFDVRSVDIAEFDFEQNRARLFIQKVGPGIREHRNPVEAMMSRLTPNFLDADALQSLDLGPLLKLLNKEDFAEARRRRCQARDQTGNIIDITSATEQDDIFDEGIYKTARDHYSGQLTSLLTNAYWKPVPEKLEREIHVLFPYRHFDNAAILPQRCLPDERGYVLSRIEAIARGES